MAQGLCITPRYWLIFIISVWLVVRITILFINKKKNKQFFLKRELVINLFALYVFCFIGITLFPIAIYWVKQQYNAKSAIVLIPFRDIFYAIKYGVSKLIITRNLLGNIFLTAPIGLFIPVLWNKKFFNIKSIALLGVVLSFLIELLQYAEGMVFPSIHTRTSDINDIILNTLGVILGYFIYSNLFKCKSIDNNPQNIVGE